MDLDLFSVNQDSVKGSGQKSPEARAAPIVLGRYGTGQESQLLWQTGPQNDRIKMARMVRKIDPLPCIRLRT